MKQFMSLPVAITLATITIADGVFAGAANMQRDTEPPGINPLAIEAEAIGALVCGATVGYGTAWTTYHLLHDIAGFRGDWGRWFAFGAALSSGYGIGVPLGSAAGTSLVGKVTSQTGSFWRSCNGACLGAASALGIAAVLWKATDDTKWPGVILALGPPAGAVIGYNLSKRTGTQTSENAYRSSPDGSQLSFLVPELELRQDRISNSIRPRHTRDPALTYKLTVTRLTF